MGGLEKKKVPQRRSGPARPGPLPPPLAAALTAPVPSRVVSPVTRARPCPARPPHAGSGARPCRAPRPRYRCRCPPVPVTPRWFPFPLPRWLRCRPSRADPPNPPLSAVRARIRHQLHHPQPGAEEAAAEPARLQVRPRPLGPLPGPAPHIPPGKQGVAPREWKGVVCPGVGGSRGLGCPPRQNHPRTELGIEEQSPGWRNRPLDRGTDPGRGDRPPDAGTDPVMEGQTEGQTQGLRDRPQTGRHTGWRDRPRDGGTDPGCSTLCLTPQASLHPEGDLPP